MLNTQLVRDQFGQYYKIHTFRDKPAPIALKAEFFSSNTQASRFVNNLIVPTGFWKNIYHAESLNSTAVPDEIRLRNEIAELFSRGKISAYKISSPSRTDHPPQKRTITDSKKNKYVFTIASTLLASTPKEVQTFTNKTDASKYLADLSPDKESLKSIVQELDLTKTSTDADLTTLLDITATALSSGAVVIIVDKYSAPPPSTTESNNGGTQADKAADKVPVPAAAATTAAENKKEEIVHLCILNKMTLSCKHGRSASLDPAAPIDKKTGMAKVPYLAVTSVSSKSPQKDQELITAKIEVNDKCDSHIKSPYIISGDTAQLVNTNFGNMIKFYSPGEELDLASKFYKYVWLPSVKPLSYKISPPTFCDMAAFDGKAKSIRLDIYPDLKWEFGLDIGYGQIKATDESPEDKAASKNNVIERKIEEDIFSVQGKAICTHGTAAPIEFVSKFKNKFDAIKQEINGQNALLSKIFGKFQEGDSHNVTLDLPKLSFKGTSSIAERKGSPEVDIKWDYNIKAAPLIGIEASVDVLPMLLRLSAWGSLFLPLLSELKEKYANPDGSIGVQLEASIILSVAGKVEFDLNFTDKSFVHDENTELRSLKFDVPFKCTGELKGKGHLLIFAAELGVTAEISTGFAYEMYMGADKKGIYRSSILHFHGITFEVKAYIEGKLNVPGKKKKGGPPVPDTIKTVKTSSSRRKEYDNKWVWIDKSEVEFNKEYIVKNA